MVIWIPSGESGDSSRSTSEAEEIFQSLVSAGCNTL
jgi:hypothetical protein